MLCGLKGSQSCFEKKLQEVVIGTGTVVPRQLAVMQVNNVATWMCGSNEGGQKWLDSDVI